MSFWFLYLLVGLAISAAEMFTIDLDLMHKTTNGDRVQIAFALVGIAAFFAIAWPVVVVREARHALARWNRK